MVEHLLAKEMTRVRFPLAAPDVTEVTINVHKVT
jgi:hypothetical protein